MCSFLPMGFFNLGPLEAVLIGVVALLLFGPRLPQVMRSLGRGIVEFKKGLRDTEDEIDRQVDSKNRSDKQIDHKSDE